MSYAENARKLKTEIDRNRETVGELQEAGGLEIQTEQSDKLGYDFKRFYVNGVLVRSDYCPQKIILGTEENPIVWKEGMSAIPNAFYTHEGVTKVWMGLAGGSPGWHDSGWEVW